jgi:hypothetical protein
VEVIYQRKINQLCECTLTRIRTAYPLGACMANQKSFVIEFRYVKSEDDAPFWFYCFGCGKWRKWKAYKKQVDANNALEALRKNKGDNFEFRHAPNKHLERTDEAAQNSQD